MREIDDKQFQSDVLTEYNFVVRLRNQETEFQDLVGNFPDQDRTGCLNGLIVKIFATLGSRTFKRTDKSKAAARAFLKDGLVQEALRESQVGVHSKSDEELVVSIVATLLRLCRYGDIAIDLDAFLFAQICDEWINNSDYRRGTGDI